MINSTGNIIAFMFCEATTPANPVIMSDSNQCVKMKVDLQSIDAWNRNKRKYTLKALKSGLYSPRIQELIAKKSWVGEAGHPIDPTVTRQCSIVEENISHRILSFEIVSGMVKGIVKTAPTPRGYDMRNFVLDDDPMETAYSLRAMGPMMKTAEGMIVQAPLTMITYDWVFFPSHSDAYQQEIIDRIQESGNALSESCISPLLQESAMDFAMHDSSNFRLVCEYLNEDIGTASLSSDCKNIILENNISNGNGEKIAVRLEKAISSEISGYFSKFR